MNEVQGPTPAGTSRPYRSLTEALRAHRVPVQNYDFITALVAAVGVTALIDRGRYIEALRGADQAALHIGRTYTNGFVENEQVVVGSATLRLQPSEGREPYWYVIHPSEYAPVSPSHVKRAATPRSSTPRTSTPRPATARAERTTVPTKPIERDYGVCEVCFMVRNASGACGCV